jgi:hypothetical protein
MTAPAPIPGMDLNFVSPATSGSNAVIDYKPQFGDINRGPKTENLLIYAGIALIGVLIYMKMK